MSSTHTGNLGLLPLKAEIFSHAYRKQLQPIVHEGIHILIIGQPRYFSARPQHFYHSGNTRHLYLHWGTLMIVRSLLFRSNTQYVSSPYTTNHALTNSKTDWDKFQKQKDEDITLAINTKILFQSQHTTVELF